MSDYCPNCGAHRSIVTGDFVDCHCTWGEIAAAQKLIRKRDRQQRKREGRPVLVDFGGDDP